MTNRDAHVTEAKNVALFANDFWSLNDRAAVWVGV